MSRLRHVDAREGCQGVRQEASASGAASTQCSTSMNRIRSYRAPTSRRDRGCRELATALLDELEETPDGTSALPDEPMVKSQYRSLRNLVYGIDTFRGLFNDRQLYVLGSTLRGGAGRS